MYSKITLKHLYATVIPFIFGTSTLVQAQDSLLSIYELAKTNDLELKSDYAEYLANREAANINRGALLPQIEGTASQSHADTNTNGADSDTDTTAFGATLSQSIYNSNAWNTYQQGKVESERAELTYKISQQSLIVRVAEAYFNVLRATDQLETAESEKKAQEALLEQTKERYEVGLIPITDVHETQAAFDSAAATSISAEASLGVQYDGLTLITGNQHSNVLTLSDDFLPSTLSPDNSQGWVDIALKNNDTLQLSELSAKAANFQRKAVTGSKRPTVTGSLSYSDQRSDLSSNTTTTDTDTLTTTISLRMPFYTGGRLSAQERQAEQNAIRAEEDLRFTQRSTVQNVRSLFLQVSTDVAQIQARKQAIISNNSALEATKAGYDAGTRDIVDIVNAQRNLFQAERDYHDALYDYIINTLQLKQTAGTLEEKDLQELESFLQ